MRSSPFSGLSLAWPRWLSFCDWLDACVAGRLPLLPGSVLQPSGVLLPAAQVIARWFGPWMQQQLAGRPRQASAASAADAEQRRRLLASDRQVGLLLTSELWLEAGWLTGKLKAELARLTRLVEAPAEDFSRDDWQLMDARYWAMVMCLTRLGQLVGTMERCQASAALV